MPRSTEIIVNRADIFRLRGQEGRAVKLYDSALQIDPDVIDAHIGKGIAYRSLGDQRNAEAEYYKALSIDPKSDKGWRYLADLHQDQGNLLQARKEYEKSSQLAVAPGPQFLENYARCLQRLGQDYEADALYAKSVAAYDKGLLIAPQWAREYVRALRSWAEVLHRTQREHEARDKTAMADQIARKYHIHSGRWFSIWVIVLGCAALLMLLLSGVFWLLHTRAVR